MQHPLIFSVTRLQQLLDLSNKRNESSSPHPHPPLLLITMRPMPTQANSHGIAAIIGVGPRLGQSIARKFAQEGYTVAILARDLTNLSRIADEIARESKAQVFAIRIDCSDSKSIREAFESVLSLGFVEVLVYNVCSVDSPVAFANITIANFQKSLDVSVVGALHCTQKVIPGMVERGKGTIIFTGSSASLIGSSGFCQQACSKFALRGLSQCLAKEYQASGVHVAHVVIDGAMSATRSSKDDDSMNPDAIALIYWQLHVQDKRAWAQEIDVRCLNNH